MTFWCYSFISAAAEPEGPIAQQFYDLNGFTNFYASEARHDVCSFKHLSLKCCKILFWGLIESRVRKNMTKKNKFYTVHVQVKNYYYIHTVIV